MLIESGVRVHLTTYERDKAQIPSNFTLKLRKHVRTRRIEKVEQLGADRVIVITCGSGVAEHKLVIELYDKGNLVLTDKDLSILTLLRSSKHDPESRVTVHDRYPIEVRQELPALSVAWLAEQMQGEKETQPLLKVLNRCIPVGREAAEHCVLAAGFSPALKMSAAPWEDAERMALTRLKWYPHGAAWQLSAPKKRLKEARALQVALSLPPPQHPLSPPEFLRVYLV